MLSKGQEPTEIAEFSIEIRESHPGTSQRVHLPENPMAWIEALRESLKNDSFVYINLRSFLGNQIEMSVTPYAGSADKDVLCFILDFATLDKLKRVIDFVHQEAFLNREMNEVNPTAPK